MPVELGDRRRHPTFVMHLRNALPTHVQDPSGLGGAYKIKHYQAMYLVGGLPSTLKPARW